MLKINTRKRAALSHVPFFVGILFLIVMYLFLSEVFLLDLLHSIYKKFLWVLIIVVIGINAWRVYFSTYLDIEFLPSHLVIREYSLFKKVPEKPVKYLEIPLNCLMGYYWDETKGLLYFKILSLRHEERRVKFSMKYLTWREKQRIIHCLQSPLYENAL